MRTPKSCKSHDCVCTLQSARRVRAQAHCRRKKTVQHLLDQAHEVQRAQTMRSYMADELIPRHKRTHEVAISGYMNLKFIEPTSNICERLFSMHGYAMRIQRENLSASAFEEQIFLHIRTPLGYFGCSRYPAAESSVLNSQINRYFLCHNDFYLFVAPATRRRGSTCTLVRLYMCKFYRCTHRA